MVSNSRICIQQQGAYSDKNVTVPSNYGREPRMGFNIRKKGKNKKVEEFVKEMKERHEEARAALVKA